MSDDAGRPGEAFIVGADQRSAGLAVRDRLFIEEERLPALLARLDRRLAGEALLLATCDRIEVIGVSRDVRRATAAALALLAEHAGMAEAELRASTYRLAGADAVRHLFRVAASLRSTVIGEPHILQQMKASLAAARAAGLAGAGLEAVMQAALACGKRVRSETTIGRRPVSAAAAAVERARSVHGDLAGCSGLLLGLGEMGTLIAQALRTAGLARLAVSHPRPARAGPAAAALDARTVGFDDLASALAEADILVTALGGAEPVIRFDTVRRALKARRSRPVLIIDVAVPGDVDAAIDRLDQAFLYTFDDLERVAEDGRQSRGAAAAAAERLVEAAAAAYIRERAERTLVPAIALLRARFEAARAAALAEAGGDADKATRLLVNRLLHRPSVALRALAADGAGDAAEGERLAALLARLFDDGGTGDDDGNDGGDDGDDNGGGGGPRG